MVDPLKISIVEDEAIVAQYLKMELEIAGFVVNGLYSNGKECIEAEKIMETDVLLMDINLNGPMDGIDTVIKIREFKEVAVIFMTGFSGKVVKEKAMKLLPVALLSKPIMVENLILILNNFSQSIS